MRLSALLLFFLINNTAFSQSYYKGLVLNNYKVTIVYPDHSVTAHIKPVKTEIFPKSDRLYYWYSGNKINNTQGGFSGSLLNGMYSSYYLNKNLKEKGEFHDGLKNGEWKAWYENGHLRERINYKLGKAHGPFYRYNNAGRLIEKGSFRVGLLAGKLEQFGEKDTVKTTFYKDGQPHVPKKKLSKFWQKFRIKKQR